MDFNKIKINYGGKLTCRKIFKKKYIIFLILSLIGLIVLISLYTVKNKNINSASNDIENYKKRQSEIENNYNAVKTRNDKEEIDLSQYRNQITSIKNDIEGVSRKEESIKKVNKQIKTERDELEKRSTSLSLEYKTQFELKGVYEQKISSLTTLLNSLKTEYEKLKEQKNR
jgi:chromosome segregation ATPase